MNMNDFASHSIHIRFFRFAVLFVTSVKPAFLAFPEASSDV
jgi:hypothetical protein